MFESFGIQRFVARWLAALLLVLATYNPSGYSYYHWISELEVGNWVLKLLVGVVLAILYATFGLATQRSLGRLGIAAWLLFFAVVTWMMIDYGLIRMLPLPEHKSTETDTPRCESTTPRRPKTIGRAGGPSTHKTKYCDYEVPIFPEASVPGYW